jgi:hypothetical protein
MSYPLNAKSNGTIVLASVVVALSATAWFLCSQRRARFSNRSQIKPPLRNITPPPGEPSKIVYLTGIDKQATECELIGLFSKGGTSPIEIDLTEVNFQNGGGRAWALFRSGADARKCVRTLHQSLFRGCILCARLELGVTREGRRITDSSTHTAVLRGIQTRRGTPKKSQVPSKSLLKRRKEQKQEKRSQTYPSDEPYITYSHKSISVGETEYPFPSGVYLTTLIQKLCPESSADDSQIGSNRPNNEGHLLKLLTSVSKLGCGSVHKYTKEVSEAFAMVDAVERCIKLVYGTATTDLHHQHSRVICYCLGDGKYPVGAAALALCMPKNWEFVAIDPLLNTGDSESMHEIFRHDQIKAVCGLSQNYSIHQIHQGTKEDDTRCAGCSSLLSIVVACHSHAPLEEFWDRVPSPKLCVSMPCCAQYSELPKESPLLEYENFEVYSPKRRIKIFASV